jgi:HEAT repeat protein
LAQAAMNALARLPGNKIDGDLLNRLPQSSGKQRRVLIELVSLRRIEGALPEVLRCAKDPDAGVRTAAIQAIGALGQEQQLTDVVGLLNQTRTMNDRGDLEAALIAISSRGGPHCAAALLPLARSNDAELRVIGLHALASAGGPEALAAVKFALNDSDENVQDEAVRTLSTWPNNWPEDDAVAEPLLALAQSAKKTSHQVLGLRGYLHYVKGDKKLSDDAKVSKLNELLPRIKRPEEIRLAIAVLDAIPTDGSLELLAAFTTDPAVTEDACASIVRIAGKNAAGITKDQRQKALQIVVEKTSRDSTRKKAQTLLKPNT